MYELAESLSPASWPARHGTRRSPLYYYTRLICVFHFMVQPPGPTTNRLPPNDDDDDGFGMGWIGRTGERRKFGRTSWTRNTSNDDA